MGIGDGALAVPWAGQLATPLPGSCVSTGRENPGLITGTSAFRPQPPITNSLRDLEQVIPLPVAWGWHL